MNIRDNNYEWTSEANECTKEIRKILEPVFKKYEGIFTLEDLYYLICTETESIVLSKVVEKKRHKNAKNKSDTD